MLDNAPEKTSLTEDALVRIREKLLDLTLRNKLINYRESSKHIRIVDELPNQIFEKLVDQVKELEFLPLPQDIEEKAKIDISNELPAAINENPALLKKHSDRFLQALLSPEKLEKKLRNATLEAHRAIQETGANLLYLTIGFLEWKDPSRNEFCKAPLIMIPVELQRKRIKKGRTLTYHYKLRYNEEDMSSNYSLCRKMNQDFGIILPDLPEEPEDIDPELYFNDVREAISAQASWTVSREMVIDFFSFAKLFMYLDLNRENWPGHNNLAHHPILTDLLLGDTNPVPDMDVSHYEIDKDRRTQTLHLVFGADSTQQTAMVDALEAKSLVIEGPPGTGKSQTITNLISTALGDNKTVLFLSEKMAALNVVKKRLEKVRLGPFILELHSKKTNKREMMTDLRQRIEYQQVYKKNTLFEQKEHDEICEELNQYAGFMQQSYKKTGRSLFDIFWRLELCRPHISTYAPPYLSNASIWTASDYKFRRELMIEIDGYVAGSNSKNDLQIDPGKSCWYGFYPENIDQGNIKIFWKVLEDIRKSATNLNQICDELQAVIGQEIQWTYQNINNFTSIQETDFLNTKNLSPTILHVLLQEENKILVQKILSHKDRAKDLHHKATKIIANVDQMDEKSFNGIRSVLEEAHNDGLLQFRYSEHIEIGGRLQKILIILNELQKTLMDCDFIPFHTPQTAKELEDLKDFTSFIANETPTETELYLADNLFIKGIGALVKRARNEEQKLNQQKRGVEKIFNLTEVTSSNEIQHLIDIFQRYSTKKIPWFYKEYRIAKHKFEEICLLGIMSKNNQDKNQIDRLPALKLLEKYLRDLDNYRNKKEYCHHLGLLFIGEQTDWNLVDRIVNFIEGLDKIVPNGAVFEHIQHFFSVSIRQISALHRAIELYFGQLRQETKILDDLFNKGSNRKGVGSRYQFDFSQKAPLFGNVDRINDLLAHIQRLRRHCEQQTISSHVTFKDLFKAIQMATEARNDLHSLEMLQSTYRDRLNPCICSNKDEFARLRIHFAWLNKLKEKRIPLPIVQWLCDEFPMDRSRILITYQIKFIQTLKHFDSMIAQLKVFGVIDREKMIPKKDDSMDIISIQSKFDHCLSEFDTIYNWIDYTRALKEANQHGLQPIMDLLEDGKLEQTDLVKTYEHGYFHSLVTDIMVVYPQINNFNRQRWQVLRDRLSLLEKNKLLTNQDRVIRSLKKRIPPKGISFGTVKNRTEMGLLRREISKVKRHVPIRSLIERSGGALQALKPCFMMSPLTVAQFLAPDAIQFDLLIMDEASQLRPEECLGAIARSKQVIVVGDPKQLAPTSFFDRVSDEPDPEDEDTALDNLESILDLFVQTYGSGRRLLWHYRSKHETLIQFSNHHFYNNTLTVFPSPRLDVADMGLQLVPIENGYCESGKNPIEAEAVARAVLDHAKNRPGLSLGVGSFNSNQRELILHAIDTELAKDPTLVNAFELLSSQQEPFFVKNLENIQGDERDVIFISYTYGPDKTSGRLYQRFGPINGKEGWRRLNVMFTRARQLICVFCSIDPKMIRLNHKSNLGLEMYKSYIEYAQTGGKRHTLKSNSINNITPCQQSILKVVRELGFEAQSNVGTSSCCLDLAVLDPKQKDVYLLGIICDSDNSSYMDSCFDRECRRYTVLENLGWRLHRIISVDWIKNRNREIQRLRQVLKTKK